MFLLNPATLFVTGLAFCVKYLLMPMTVVGVKHSSMSLHVSVHSVDPKWLKPKMAETTITKLAMGIVCNDSIV